MALFEPGIPRTKTWGHAAWFGSWLAITLICLQLSASPRGHGTHQQLGLPPCPTVLLMHRPCPGCGLTTSWTALLHGQFAESIRAHALGPITYIGFAISALLSGYAYLRGWRFDTDSRAMNRLMAWSAVIFFAYGIARFALMRMDP